LNLDWITDVVFISFLVYALTGVFVVTLYILLRWRKTRLPLEYVAYFAGGLFIVVGGSMGIESTPQQSSLIFSSIFFFAQGVAIICLTYCKERQDKRKQRETE
jgi:predicted tellurium resistance membrane protein TerC